MAPTVPIGIHQSTCMYVAKAAVAAGREAGACAPGGTLQGAAFGGAKIWNSGIFLLLAN